jgi:D-glycero-D-manno-heptose 1,7-bisphosphate phosphatase
VSAGEAVFLDRDGIICDLVVDPSSGTPESPYRAEDVRILDGVSAALEALAGAGMILVVASNQPAAAKGIATPEALAEVHRRVVELLGPSRGSISAWRYCYHHPDARDPLLRECECRKPKPGMLRDAARDLALDLERSWMVGDADRDIEAGAAAGCRTALVEHGASNHRRTGASRPTLCAGDLATATGAILERRR